MPPDARAVVPKIAEEISEIEAELDGSATPAALEEEVGDLLFAAANLARKLDVEPETALRSLALAVPWRREASCAFTTS